MNRTAAKTGALLCGHGSRDEEARAEFDRFVAATRTALSNRGLSIPTEGGYLEFLHPTIEESFVKLAQAGATRIMAQPLMLFAARHATKDIPGQANAFAASHPCIRIDCGQELSLDTKIFAAACDRVSEATAAAKSTVRYSDTLLLVIGRGSADAHANLTLADLAGRLGEKFGAAKVEIAFAGIAKPSISDGLDQARSQGYPHVVILPYFLFTGVLVKRIHTLAREAARKNPHVEFLVAGHLSNHPLVVESVVDRILTIERSV